MIPKELNIRSAAIHKIIHEELLVEKRVCRCVLNNLTENQKEQRVKINQKKTLNC